MSVVRDTLRPLTDRELRDFQAANEVDAAGPDPQLATAARWWLEKIRAEWRRRPGR